MILGDDCRKFLCCWDIDCHGMLCYGVECSDICKLFRDGMGYAGHFQCIIKDLLMFKIVAWCLRNAKV